jgi:hypothetical protein
MAVAVAAQVRHLLLLMALSAIPELKTAELPSGCGTADRLAMLESDSVRHRSYATHSRQPRQVRKEATVTGSCVCSGVPVSGFL